MPFSISFRRMLLGLAAGAILALPGAGSGAICPQSADDAACPPPCFEATYVCRPIPCLHGLEMQCPPPPCDPAACPMPPDPCQFITCEPPNPCVTIECVRQLIQNLCEKLQLCMVCPQSAISCPPPCYQSPYYCPPPCYVVDGDLSYVCPAPCPPQLVCVEPAS